MAACSVARCRAGGAQRSNDRAPGAAGWHPACDGGQRARGGPAGALQGPPLDPADPHRTNPPILPEAAGDAEVAACTGYTRPPPIRRPPFTRRSGRSRNSGKFRLSFT